MICFAGSTEYAYPLMLQMRAAIELFPKSSSRAMPLPDVRGHILRVFDEMRSGIHDLPVGHDTTDAPDIEFIFGGYDWRARDFALWILHFDAHIQRFTFRPATLWRGVRGNRRILLVGDELETARERLIDLLTHRGKRTEGSFDMEPLEVLRDMIREGVSPQIGGPPQVAKVYEHLNSLHFGVRWPGGESEGVAARGRPLLDYEKPDCPVIDPDTLEVTWL